MADSASQVARILYKEIVQGDLRKILAQSNDSDSGGGARDFRFGSYHKLLPIIKKMFPAVLREARRRGIDNEADVFEGRFSWYNKQGKLETESAYFESPTNARPSEGRIRRVHEYGCFDTSLIPSGGEENRVFLLLVQLTDKSVWPYFAEEKTLRTPGAWDPVVADEILSCLDAKRRQGQAVIGYRDFTNMDSYCNGK